MSKAFSIARALSNPDNVEKLRRHGVIYVDRGLIALNKGPDLVTQGTRNVAKKSGTIQVVIDDIRNALALKEGPFTIHRLDKNTTGLLTLAPTATQAKVLSKAYGHAHRPGEKNDQPVKTYLALVHIKSRKVFDSYFTSKPRSTGLAERQEVRTSVNIQSSIYIQDNGYVSSAPPDLERQNGKERVGSSTIELIAESPRFPIALMGLQLHTGIKHQLRVTMSNMKAPILGDDRYGEESDKTDLPADIFPPNALMLHSNSLEIKRYRHGSGFVTFKVSAPPPPTFMYACKRAGIKFPLDVPTGGVWVNGKEMTEELMLGKVLAVDNAVDNEKIDENGFWLVN